MSERRVDWAAVGLYTVLGAVGLAFIGYVLWRLALAVDWMAAALLGFVIVFGLLMVSFDLRRGPGTGTAEFGADPAPAKPARRGRPRKPRLGDEARTAAPTPSAPPPADGEPPARGPRNRAGRAPIADPPAGRRPRRRS